MQGHDADTAAAGFGEGQLNELAGETPAPVFGLHVDIQQVAAPGRARIERVGRPVQQEQPGSGDRHTLILGDPADVQAVGDGFGHPGLVRLRHHLQDLIVAPPGIDEHPATMTSDEGSVGSNRQPGSQHDEKYKTSCEPLGGCRRSRRHVRDGPSPKASSMGVVATAPKLDLRQLHPGMQAVVAVSGGADSVGLLRALVLAAPQIGLVLSVAHVHHGIRGEAADEDARFVAGLAAQFQLPFLFHQTDTPARAWRRGETLEEAGRHDRYAWFRELLAQGKANAVATAHTLDDQAETVLHRLLRGAWTEGLGGIHPTIVCPGGVILRPLLEARRAGIASWLREIGQPWREDASNADRSFTRNRIRHELLPQLAEYNPRVEEQLARLATLARDEEAWWETELSRLLPSLILPGRPVRGGGRAVSTHPNEGSVGMELERLRDLAPAVRRRALRAAARQLGCELNFEQTDRLLAMCDTEAPRRQQLTAELRADRSARELRLARDASGSQSSPAPQPVDLPIPGEGAGFGVRLRATIHGAKPDAHTAAAKLRPPHPGDRVRLRHSRNARPLKEIFERMQVEAERRMSWPLLEWEGRIVWMQGVDVDPGMDLPFAIEAVSEETEDLTGTRAQRGPLGGHS